MDRGGEPGDHGLFPGGDTVPVVGYEEAIVHPPQVLRLPVAVAHDLRTLASRQADLGAPGDIGNPARHRIGREVRPLVVPDGPGPLPVVVPSRPGRGRLERGHVLDGRSQGHQPAKLFGVAVRVALELDAARDVMLSRGHDVGAEWDWVDERLGAWEPRRPQRPVNGGAPAQANRLRALLDDHLSTVGQAYAGDRRQRTGPEQHLRNRGPEVLVAEPSHIHAGQSFSGSPPPGTAPVPSHLRSLIPQLRLSPSAENHAYRGEHFRAPVGVTTTAEERHIPDPVAYVA